MYAIKYPLIPPPLFLVIKVNNAIVTKNLSAGTKALRLKHTLNPRGFKVCLSVQLFLRSMYSGTVTVRSRQRARIKRSTLIENKMKIQKPFCFWSHSFPNYFDSKLKIGPPPVLKAGSSGKWVYIKRG